MKLSTIFLLITLAISSTVAYPASGHPDDDAEVVDVNGNQPHIPQPPPIPSIPSIPIYPSVGVPEIPPTGFTPVYNPGFVVDTGVQYVPFGWTYNIFDGFNDFFRRVRDRASLTWSNFPSFRPFFTNFWPSFKKTNGTTTSTVHIVGDHKYTINETVHVQKTNFGDVFYKVRTVDIQPVEPEDTTEPREDGGVNPGSEVDIDEVPATTGPETFDTREDADDDNDERTNSDGDADIDGTVDIDGQPAQVPDSVANEISRLETFETVESDESNENKNIEKEFLKNNEKISIESLSSELQTDGPSSGETNEWFDVEIETNQDSDQDKTNTFYDVTNGNEQMKPISLSNDIAINQMLADEGAEYDPDAEIFDIHQYELNAQSSAEASPEESNSQKHEAIDYLPYHHQSVDKQPKSIK